MDGAGISSGEGGLGNRHGFTTNRHTKHACDTRRRHDLSVLILSHLVLSRRIEGKFPFTARGRTKQDSMLTIDD